MKSNDVKRLLSLCKKSALVIVSEKALVIGGTATSTDLETSLTVKTDIQGEGVVDLVAIKNAGKYDSAWIEGETLFIKKGGGVMKSKAWDVAEYPVLPEITEETAGELIHKDVQTLKRLVAFVSTDEMRPAMTGVYCNGTHFNATDAHTLSWEKTIGQMIPEMIIPKSAIAMLNQTMSYRVFVNTEHDTLNRVSLANAFETISFKPIDAIYPNFVSVIPFRNDIKVTIDTEELKQAINRALPSANKETKTGIFTFTQDSIKITAEDADYGTEYSETISAPLAEMAGAQGLTIGFNLAYLKRLLGTISVPTTYISISTPNRAVIFNYRSLLMPVMIDGSRTELDDPKDGKAIYEVDTLVRVYDPLFDEHYTGKIAGSDSFALGRVLYYVNPQDGNMKGGREVWEENITFADADANTETTTETTTKTPIKGETKIGKILQQSPNVVVCSIPVPEPTAPEVETAEDVAETETMPVAEQELPEVIILENITPKAFAVVGNCSLIPEGFRTKFGQEGKFPVGELKMPGFIFSKKRREALAELFTEAGITNGSIE